MTIVSHRTAPRAGKRLAAGPVSTTSCRPTWALNLPGKGAPAGRISTQREVRLASVDGQLAPGIGARLCVRCLTRTRYKVLSELHTNSNGVIPAAMTDSRVRGRAEPTRRDAILVDILVDEPFRVQNVALAGSYGAASAACSSYSSFSSRPCSF